MKKLFFALLIFTLLLAGCDSSGSSSGVSKNCQSSGSTLLGSASGSCTIQIQSIQGTVFERIENDSFRTGDQAAAVTLTVTSTSGAVQVSISDQNGKETSVTVQPGQSARLQGTAVITGTSPRSFSVNFKAVDGKASGIKADLQYKSE